MSEFCDCINNKECPISAVEPRFSEIVHLEVTVEEILPKIALQDIPKVLTKLSSRLEFAAVIVLSGDHFYTVSIDANGSYHKYDDTKENIEIIKPSQLVNPQHLIFLNKS